MVLELAMFWAMISNRIFSADRALPVDSMPGIKFMVMLYSSSDRKIKFFDGTTNRTTEVFVVQSIFVHGKHFLIELDGVAIHTNRFCLPIFHASGKKGLNPPEVFPVYGSSQLNGKGFRKVPSFESRGLNIGKVVGECFVTQMGSIKKFLGNKIIFLGIKIVEYNGHFR